MSSISFGTGVYVAQNYQVPDLKKSCSGASKWTNDKWEAVKKWEKDFRK